MTPDRWDGDLPPGHLISAWCRLTGFAPIVTTATLLARDPLIVQRPFSTDSAASSAAKSPFSPVPFAANFCTFG